MPVVTITIDDLTPFVPDLNERKAEAMIEDTLARAMQIAPCIGMDTLSANGAAAAKAILRKVILRWNDAGSGALTNRQVSAGPYQQSETVDTRQRERALFWPNEIKELQDLCRDATSNHGKAFSINQGTRQYVNDQMPTNLRDHPEYWLQWG